MLNQADEREKKNLIGLQKLLKHAVKLLYVHLQKHLFPQIMFMHKQVLIKLEMNFSDLFRMCPLLPEPLYDIYVRRTSTNQWKLSNVESNWWNRKQILDRLTEIDLSSQSNCFTCICKNVFFPQIMFLHLCIFFLALHLCRPSYNANNHAFEQKSTF